MKQKIGIISLGCPRNLVDSEHLLGRLAVKGRLVTDIAEADIGIVNTCGFVQDAKIESIEAITGLVELKRSGRLSKVVVCGCLAQRYPEELRREFPEVDAFIGVRSLDGGEERYPLTPKSYAYLKISEGCVNNCSFCAVPRIKTRLESLDERRVLRRLRQFDRAGVTEVDIIGQDITGYGLDRSGRGRLPELIASMLSASRRKRRWFRLMYLHPSRVSKDLLSLMARDARVCKYIDLPLQHISDRILRSMNRHITRGKIISLIRMIRKTVPDVAIRTTFIVGFPGETDKDFEELLAFIRETRFERLGAFIYSAEEGTRACSFPGQVPLKTAKERFKRVMLAQQRISREHNAALLGRELEVLVDGEEDGRWIGRTQWDAPEVDGTVYLSSGKGLEAGDLVRAKITDTLEYDLCAEVKP